MKSKLTFVLALLALQSAITSGQTTAVPGTISYQGRAYTSSGTLLGAGTPVNRTVIFRVWDSATATTAANLLYSESQTVTISEGEFSVLIGNGIANTTQTFGYSETSKHSSASPAVNLVDVFNGATRYLSVTIANGTAIATSDAEITPRQQIVSSAFAFRSKYAESLGTSAGTTLKVLDNGNVGIGNANPPSIFTITGANSSSATTTPQLLITDSADTNERLRIGVDNTGSGTGFLQAYKEGVGAQNLLLNPSGGNVGIGTTSPAVKLDVNGGIRALGGGNTATPNSGGYSFGTGGDTDGGFFSPADGVLTLNTNGTERMRVNASGYVGVGTSSPASQFQVKFPSVNITSSGSNEFVPHALQLSSTAASNPISLYGGIDETNGTSYLQSIKHSTSNSPLVLNPRGGKVGVNTATPYTNFMVSSGVNGWPQTTGSYADQTAAGFRLRGADNAVLDMGVYGTNGAWLQCTDQGVLSNNFPLFLNPNGGNVGIGTTSASKRLTVITADGSNDGVKVASASGAYTVLGANMVAASYNAIIQAGDNALVFSNGGSGSGALAIAPYNSSNSATTGMRMTGEGKVFINTIGPGVSTASSLFISDSITCVGTRTTNSQPGYASLRYEPTVGRADLIVYNSGQAGLTPRTASYDGDSNIDFSSDRRLKKNIVDAEPMLDRLMQLPFRRFQWNDQTAPDAKQEFGVIAQEVQPLFPDLVATGKDGFFTVGYTTFGTIACKAVQELKFQVDDEVSALNEDLTAVETGLQQQLDEKDRKIADLEARLEALEQRLSATQPAAGQTAIEPR